MSTLGEYWKDVKPIMKRERNRRREANAARVEEILKAKGVKYQSFNGGLHLRFTFRGRKVDVWPTSDKFRIDGESTRHGFVKWAEWNRASQDKTTPAP